MTPTQKKVLAALAEREATTKDLVASLSIPRRTIYSAIRDAVTLGWIHARPNLKDTRQRIFSLTAQGRGLAF